MKIIRKIKCLVALLRGAAAYQKHWDKSVTQGYYPASDYFKYHGGGIIHFLRYAEVETFLICNKQDKPLFEGSDYN